MATWADSNFNYSENWLKFSANSDISYQSSFAAPGSASISLTYTTNPGYASRTKRVTLSKITGDTDPSNDYVDVTQEGSTYDNIVYISYADNVEYESGTDTYVFDYSYAGDDAYIEITFETNMASHHQSFGAPTGFSAAYYIQTTYNNGNFGDSSKIYTASNSSITWPSTSGVGFFDKAHGYIKYRFTSNGNLTGTPITGEIRFTGGQIIKYRINAISGADVAFATQSIAAGSSAGTATVTLNSNIVTNYTLTIGNPS